MCAAQLVLHLCQAVGMVVGIGVHFRLRGLARRRMRMCAHGRPVGKGIDRAGHVVASRQVALHAPGHPSPDVVVIGRIQHLSLIHCQHLAAGQESLRADGRRREVAVVESSLAAEVIIVVMVL